MKKIILLSVIFVALVFTSKAAAQGEEKLTYFYIEKLTLENYKELLVEVEESSAIEIDYACVPAKIIGVKKEYVKLIASKLKSLYKAVQQKELSQEEAEKECANQRSLH